MGWHGERDVDYEEIEAKGEYGCTGGFDLFEGDSGPGEHHALNLVLLEELLHLFEALAGAEAGGRRAVDLGGAEEVVVVDDLRSGRLLDLDKVVEREHLSAVEGNIELTHVLRTMPRTMSGPSG